MGGPRHLTDNRGGLVKLDGTRRMALELLGYTFATSLWRMALRGDRRGPPGFKEINEPGRSEQGSESRGRTSLDYPWLEG